MQDLTPQDMKTLSACPLFRDIDLPRLLCHLDGVCTTLDEGAFLVRESEPVTRLWIVLEGIMHASCHSYNGQEFLYQQLRPSYMAGGEVVCTRRKTCPYSIYAKTPCRLWSFHWSIVENERLPHELHTRLMQNMLSFVSNQNMHKYVKIEALSQKSARAKIMKYLVGQSLRSHSASFTITMDREAMANFLCLNRSVLSHELKKMEADGILKFHKNSFTLLGDAIPSQLR